MWDRATLTILPGDGSGALSINNAGVIVGTYAVPSGLHAAIWINKKLIDLNTNLNGYVPAGVYLYYATAINDAGQILSQAIDGQGCMHVYLFTPSGASPAAAKPEYSLLGRTYDAPQTVVLSDATPNALIHYTLDGCTPTTASPVYTSPLLIARTTTINAAATSPTNDLSAVATVTYVIAVPAGPEVPSVDLRAVANVHATGTVYNSARTPGIDGTGGLLAGGLLGTSLIWNTSSFTFAPTDTLNGVSGATIPLPGGSYATLNLLALGVQGLQSKQNFVIRYADGSSSTQTRDVGDWSQTQLTNQSAALRMRYRANSGGDLSAGPYYLSGYAFTLDPTKVAASITLPTNSHVVILGAALADPAGGDRHVERGNLANVFAVTTEKRPVSAGMDTYGNAYAAELLGSTLARDGSIFAIADQATRGGITSTTPMLPSGHDQAIKLLATAVNGAHLAQPFTVNYANGSSGVQHLSLSDWRTPRSFSGESLVSTIAYRIDAPRQPPPEPLSFVWV